MVYIFLANGFEEIEAITPIDLLRRAGADVKLVGIGGKAIVGRSNITVTCDVTEDNVRYEDVEMVILPGGMPGTKNLEKSRVVTDFIKKAYIDGKKVAAICAAPMILGKLGLLEGRKATCFPGFEEYLKGANLSHDSVCVDSNIITAKGAGVAVKFGLTLIKELFGKEVSDEIRESVQCE
jgi:4-methyl-5(b-hydroxyethyl)-thiazole monophosphate biosynthesis